MFDSIVPHVTVANGHTTLLDQAESDVLESLPIGVAVREVVLIEEVILDWGRWQTRANFALNPAA
jgi:hypothetical protein